VRFDDVLVARVPMADGFLLIDDRYLAVCEPGSIEACGCVADLPVAVGAMVDGDQVRLRFGRQRPKTQVQVVVRLTGIRKGFRGLRFPSRTRAQFEANERFIKSAYDHGD